MSSQFAAIRGIIDITSKKDFWTIPVLHAFQPSEGEDMEPDQWLSPRFSVNAGPSAQGLSPVGLRPNLGETPKFGTFVGDPHIPLLGSRLQLKNLAVLYVETIREKSDGFVGSDVQQISLSRIMAHEIGHAIVPEHRTRQGRRGLMEDGVNLNLNIDRFLLTTLDDFRSSTNWTQEGGE